MARRRVGVLVAATLITGCAYDWDGPLRDRGDAGGIGDADGRDASDADSTVPQPPDAQPDTCTSMCCSSTPGLCRDTSVSEDTGPDPCSGREDGLYCGFNLKGEGENPQTLYQCKNQQVSIAQVCKSMCIPSGMGGMDSCANTMTSDGGADASQGPCTGLKPGTYCGVSLMMNPSILYECGGGPPVVAQTCKYGCTQAMGGMDSCTPAMSD